MDNEQREIFLELYLNNDNKFKNFFIENIPASIYKYCDFDKEHNNIKNLENMEWKYFL